MIKSRSKRCFLATKKCHEVFAQICMPNVCSVLVSWNVWHIMHNVLGYLWISSMDFFFPNSKWYGLFRSPDQQPRSASVLMVDPASLWCGIVYWDVCGNFDVLEVDPFYLHECHITALTWAALNSLFIGCVLTLQDVLVLTWICCRDACVFILLCYSQRTTYYWNAWFSMMMFVAT
jgi:hypothetical protein